MKKYVTIFTLISLIVSGFLFVDSRYATSKSMLVVSNRLDYKILSDHYNSIQERIWKLQDRLSKIANLETKRMIKNEVRKLTLELDNIKRKLKKLRMSE